MLCSTYLLLQSFNKFDAKTSLAKIKLSYQHQPYIPALPFIMGQIFWINRLSNMLFLELHLTQRRRKALRAVRVTKYTVRAGEDLEKLLKSIIFNIDKDAIKRSVKF